MNYGIFKGGKYTSGDDRPSPIRRHMEQDKKPLKRRYGCMVMLLPVAVILMYLFIRFGLR